MHWYFGGSLTEAASHLATNVCNSYLDPIKNNPLSPIPPLAGKRRSRLTTDTNPHFLDTPPKMAGDRCSRCHRYKKDPPTVDVGHDGSQAESKCRLAHHPFPCDFVDGDGDACTAEASTEGDEEAERHAQLAAAAAKKANDMENQLEKQSSQMEEMKRQMHEMRQMMGSMRMPADTRSSLASSCVATPAGQITGGSTVTTASITAPQPSLLPRVAGVGIGSLLTDAQDLINVNEADGPAVNSLPGYTGSSMKDLQQDRSIAAEVQRQLDSYIAQIPGLQKVVAGQSVPLTVPINTNPSRPPSRTPHNQHIGRASGDTHLAYQAIQAGAAGLGNIAVDTGGGVPNIPRDEVNLLDMDTMLGLTVREKQYRPHEFASRGNFFYARNINDRNITLPLYMYGYLKHCIILLSGLVPVAEGEVMARLINLMNICEITSNNSTLNDFDHLAWQLGRGYGDRVLNDIQQGLRSWPEMPNHILPDVFLHVKDMIDTQTRKKDDGNACGGRAKRGGGGQGRGSSDKQGGSKVSVTPLVCTSYNDFFTGSGCAYEFNNQRKCTYEHYCSKCFAADGTKVVHKGRFCGVAAAATSAPVTTSG